MGFKELKLKVTREFDNQANFAKAMDMSLTAINQRLNSSVEWRLSDIKKACRLLHIDNEDIALYFFD